MSDPEDKEIGEFLASDLLREAFDCNWARSHGHQCDLSWNLPNEPCTCGLSQWSRNTRRLLSELGK